MHNACASCLGQQAPWELSQGLHLAQGSDPVPKLGLSAGDSELMVKLPGSPGVEVNV